MSKSALALVEWLNGYQQHLTLQETVIMANAIQIITNTELKVKGVEG